jgi:hypothetical protein
MISGVLAAGEVTMLIAEAGVGKSTLAHQMAMTVASGASHFLGLAIPEAARGRMGMLLSAEEGKDTIERRTFMFARQGLRGDVFSLSRPLGGLDEALQQISEMPSPGVVVIDPMRTWLTGKEEDSENVSEFLSKCQAFARAKGVAFMVIHHTRRRGERDRLNTTQDVVKYMRGSQVIYDRPRVLLAMVNRKDGTTELGVVKSNLKHAIPLRTFRLRFDPATEMYHALDAPAVAPGAPAPAAGGPSRGETVAAVVTRITKANGTIRKTGERGLFVLRETEAPELRDWSRSEVSTAVHEAIAARLIRDDRRDGLLPAE